MDSDLHHQHHNHQQQVHQPQQQMMNSSSSSSGLTRYRSAPSSYFSNLINSGIYGDDDNSDPFRVSNAESDQILSRFTNSASGSAAADSTSQRILNQIAGFEPNFMDSVKQEQEGGIYSDTQQQQQTMIYQNQNQFQSQSQTDRNNLSVSSSMLDESIPPMNLPTNLLRQSSSPAGFFAHLEIDNGYSMMRSMDDFGAGRGSVPDSLLSSTKRLKSEMGFSTSSHSSAGILPRIPENDSKVMGVKNSHNDGGFGETHSQFQGGSWDDSDILSDSFLKELGESDHKLSSLNSSRNQNDVGRIRAPSTLVHHMSLPTSTAELDKILQFQDSVPLRSRAKRGCATHPRSIAERVRRTRISERMRKLQELVPNMDKQTNTADMLDLAVDYIKDLQKEAETLSEHHAKCTCPHKQKV